MDKSCYECGSTNLEEDWSKPPTLTVTCKQCGFNVVTSKFPKIFSDENIYKIYLIKTDNDSKETLLIKREKQLSLIEAKELYEKESRVFLFEGKAIDVFNSVKNLEKEYTILVEPKFNYTDKDLNGMKLA